jgi:hypothetical protein
VAAPYGPIAVMPRLNLRISNEFTSCGAGNHPIARTQRILITLATGDGPCHRRASSARPSRLTHSKPAGSQRRRVRHSGPASQPSYPQAQKQVNKVASGAGARPDQCSEASCHSSGWKSRQQRSPDTVVVISSDGEGDRSVESLEVKAPGGWETGQIRTGGPAT